MNIPKLKLRFIAAALLTATLCVGCAGNDETTVTSVFTPDTGVILSYSHSSDYSTYKLDWIEKNGVTYTVKANQISVNPSSGLKSPTFSSTHILLVDSSTTGRLLVYSRANNSLVAQLTLGSSPQEMVINGNTAYIPLYGTTSGSSNIVKRVDISNVSNPVLMSDIIVGQKPSAIRKWNEKIYVGNQDSLNKTQATVSIIDPFSGGVSTSVNVGENPTDITSDGSNIWSYNAKWFGGTSASLTYINASNVAANVAAYPPTYAPAYGGGIAFRSSGGFVLLNNGSTLADFSNLLHLFSITGTTITTTAVDSVNQYRFLGAGTAYLYKIHNGNGSTSNLTTIIENLSGALQTTQTLTKDSDMYFFANQ